MANKLITPTRRSNIKDSSLETASNERKSQPHIILSPSLLVATIYFLLL